MRKQYRKAISLLSGGIDSAVVTAYARSLGYDVTPMLFDYGQLTIRKEQESLMKLAKALRLRHPIIMKLPWLREISQSSGLVNKSVQLRNKKEWVREYVPFRNTIFLAIATAFAESHNVDAIFIGSTASDRICPDNRLPYLLVFQRVMRLGTKLKTNVKLNAPFAGKSKIDVVKIGHRLKVPFQLTWSCHKSNKKACGLCSNCVSRLKAFKKNRLQDPIPYEKRNNWND